MSTDYRLPAFPFGSSEATIVRWLKQPGDALAPGEPLLAAMNDRVEVLFPANGGGILEALLVAEGAAAAVGVPIARIASAAPAPRQAGPMAESRQQAAGAAGPPATSVSDGATAPAGPRRASPVALRIAGISDIDITVLTGTGPSGRIVKSDVLAALAARPSATDHRPGDKETRRQGDKVIGEQERYPNLQPPTSHLQSPDESETQTSNLKPQTSNLVPPSPMRRAIAEHMVRSRATSPHAMTAMEVDMGQVAAERARCRPAFARRGLDLTYTACIALAAVEALLRHPLLNGSWSEDAIILRRRVHLGIAVALPDGLVTPVVRDAQDLNARGMARAIGDLAGRARARSLQAGETSGGTFTITNPGSGALWFGTPIISQPQSAILGVGTVQLRPLVVSVDGADRVAIRPAALLTLAYDARVHDQVHADAFLRDVKHRLEHFQASP